MPGRTGSMRTRSIHKAALTDAVTPLEESGKKLAYKAAVEGIVLLENDGSLPLKAGKIALYGAGAKKTIKGGTGSGEVNERHAVSVFEGLEQSGFTVTTMRWIEDYDQAFEEGEQEYAEEFRKKLSLKNLSDFMNLMSSPYRYPYGRAIQEKDIEESDTDSCIYVVSRQAGEGADRKLDENEYGISEIERINIAFCAERYAVMERLTLRDMAELSVGGGMTGSRFFEAPGAAGVTCTTLEQKGIPNVVMADGPAGLRLNKVSSVSFTGKVKGIEPNISCMKYLPELVKKIMLGNPDSPNLLYQFTTAFPSGISLASSWNLELAEEVGNAVGKEMECYGVTYWLAPGLNIHRNPLCGRNFEYYSEDPLVSGKFAAAITKGVQKNRGCYVTLKHFCCNNQEDNRNKTNVNVNERALREIYLKGFEIAVKEAGPGAIMSSYNKVNGKYVNNSYRLLTQVLRNEWGFDGLVMTDWFATGRKYGNPAHAIASGNDLIMPGSAGAVDEIVKAVSKGVILEEDVKRSAANVLRGVLSSRIYQGFTRMHMKK